MNNLIKYRPTSATKTLFDSFMEDILNGDIAVFVCSDWGYFQPAVNIRETATAVKVDIAAPGFEKKDFEVKIEQKRLIVNGRPELAPENPEQRNTRREFLVRPFTRTFDLPDSVNQNEITAVYENGVLGIVLNKIAEKQSLVRTIEIG